MFLNKIFNRRKHKRFTVSQKAYLVFQFNTSKEKKFQILDISEGGCAFIYHGDINYLDELNQISLMSDAVPELEQVRISNVSDQPASGPFRRRSVEFKWLGTLDKEKLKRFIHQISITR